MFLPTDHFLPPKRKYSTMTPSSKSFDSDILVTWFCLQLFLHRQHSREGLDDSTYED